MTEFVNGVRSRAGGLFRVAAVFWVVVALAREPGMKYMVLTTRHHDGYCLFDSEPRASDPLYR